MGHPNTVDGYAGVSVIAAPKEHESLRNKFSNIYGDVVEMESGFSVETANGRIQIQSKEAIESTFGELPSTVNFENEVGIVAMDFYCQSLKALGGFISESGLAYTRPNANPYNNGNCLLLSDPTLTGNTFLRFIER
jgi:hypothetical protein